MLVLPQKDIADFVEFPGLLLLACYLRTTPNFEGGRCHRPLIRRHWQAANEQVRKVCHGHYHS